MQTTTGKTASGTGNTANGGGCAGTNRRGEPCNAAPVEGSPFCYFHDPEKAEDREKSRRRGGKARHGRKIGTTWADLPPAISFDSVEDVLAYLGRAAADLARLENSVSRARAMTQVASVAVGVLQVGQLEERLKVLEEALNGQKH